MSSNSISRLSLLPCHLIFFCVQKIKIKTHHKLLGTVQKILIGFKLVNHGSKKAITRQGKKTTLVHAQLLFTNVKNNYSIYITVRLHDSSFWETASTGEQGEKGSGALAGLGTS